MKSVLSDELVTRLRHFAACMVKETLCTRVEHMAMLAPMANKPAPEVLLNTKMSMQFSYSAPHVSSLPIIDRLCAQCAIGAVVSGTCNVCSDNGCSECIGRHYMCHTCNTRFTRRWAYETGSGRSSVGRNPKQFRVLDFTDDMVMARDTWMASVGGKVEYNSIVLVMYCGASMCGHCALKTDHGSISCGTLLGMHRDNGGGGNSQAMSNNRTLNVGHTRTLSMQLRKQLGGGLNQEVSGSWTDFAMVDGSEFILDARDEVATHRATPGGSVYGAWYHGMQTELTDDDISAGFVARHVKVVCDVRLEDDIVIDSRKGCEAKMEKQKEYDDAQQWWQGHCDEYRTAVQPAMEKALRQWRSLESRLRHRT